MFIKHREKKVPNDKSKNEYYYRDPNTRAGGIEEQGGKMYEI